MCLGDLVNSSPVIIIIIIVVSPPFTRSPDIPPNTSLVYDLELIDIRGPLDYSTITEKELLNQLLVILYPPLLIIINYYYLFPSQGLFFLEE